MSSLTKSQEKLIKIIIKLNPKISVADAAKAYKVLKELESK